MTEKKKTTAAAKKAPAKKAEAEQSSRVAVLQTHVNIPLVIRGNPSEEDVLKFVKEQNRRYQNGDQGGPSGQPAVLVRGGAYFDEESPTDDYDFEQGAAIDLGEAL